MLSPSQSASGKEPSLKEARSVGGEVAAECGANPNGAEFCSMRALWGRESDCHSGLEA